jgi:hypothetical protein
MSANRTGNVHLHRLRHRRRFSATSQHLRKLQNYLTVQAARLNTVGTVAGVTPGEVQAAHNTPPHFVRARYVRAASTNAEVAALGIPVA